MAELSKALLPIAAKAMDDSEFDAWFAGRIPRRILSVPFGGPIPSAKSARGIDLDGEFFSERTDIYGPYPELRRTRERLIDWSHAFKPPQGPYGDPTGMMSGHVLGKSILDPDPEEDGWWADAWFERGNSRVELIKRLAARGAQLFGSTQPLGKTSRNPDGEITLWPVWLQTLTTAPQNTHSVIRPKAALDYLTGDPYWSDIEAAMRDLGTDLRLTSLGEDGAKAGRVLSAVNESDIQAAMTKVDEALASLRSVVSRQSKPAVPEDAKT